MNRRTEIIGVGRIEAARLARQNFQRIVDVGVNGILGAVEHLRLVH